MYVTEQTRSSLYKEQNTKFQLVTSVVPFDSSCMLKIVHQLPSESGPGDLCTFELKRKAKIYIYVQFSENSSL